MDFILMRKDKENPIGDGMNLGGSFELIKEKPK